MNFPVLISYFTDGEKVDLVSSVNAFPVGKNFRILCENATEQQRDAIRMYIDIQNPYRDDDIPF